MESSTPQNPYRAPVSTASPYQTGGVYYRKDEFLLIRDGAVLPARCIKTNQPVGPKDWTKRVQLNWTPPWVYFFLLAGLLPMLLLAVVTSKKAKLTYTLCREERTRVVKRKTIAALGFFGAVAALIAGLANLEGNAMGIAALVAVILMIGSLAVIALTNSVTVKKHKDGWFTIKGCSPEFLNSL